MTPEKVLEDQIIMVIKTVEDPEIPVNIYELGLIYDIEVRTKVENLEMVNKSTVTITWEPTWDQSFMSEEAKLELGML